MVYILIFENNLMIDDMSSGAISSILSISYSHSIIYTINKVKIALQHPINHDKDKAQYDTFPAPGQCNKGIC